MQNVLIGVVCLDRYLNLGLTQPGCGILHNAYHLQQLGCDPLLITRIGADDGEPCLAFLRRHGIRTQADGIGDPGPSATIAIALDERGEARISNFSPGVWRSFRLTPAEEAAVAAADHLHLVLVGRAVAELARLRQAGALANTLVSADFLALQDFSPARFTQVLTLVDLAFVGWQGDPADARLDAIRQAAQAHGKVVIVTLGSRGVLLFDGRPGAALVEQFVPVQPVAVTGSTNGCGDAFISYFLADYWRSRDLLCAVEAGKLGGAAATQWRFALPDAAYAEE
jgi:sugar/nucleoside kinase (ribokinase family)